MSLRRQDDAAWRCKSLKASRNIYAVSKYISVFLHENVSDIDADAQLKRVADQGILNRDRAPDCTKWTGKLREKTVPHCLEEPPFVRVEGRLYDVVTKGPNGSERAIFVSAHHRRITHQIGGQDGGKPARNTARLSCQKKYPLGFEGAGTRVEPGASSNVQSLPEQSKRQVG
ncbi:hypothetical protein DK26_17510 [Bosea sp. WAO]|nr:hypothetical protein DK26_17510 [Bosea sp. WAO]